MAEYKKYIQEFFDQFLNSNRANFESVGWGSRDSQIIRFSVLSEIANLNNKTILDVGCGLGDFYNFLIDRYEIKNYIGIDINENMILAAKENIKDTRFEVKDLLIDNMIGTFDYVFESGIFNLDTEDWSEVVYPMLIKMFSLCRLGMGINFLSSFSPYDKNIKSKYICPGKMCKFINDNLSNKFVMRHDYKDNDVSFYIYKDMQ